MERLRLIITERKEQYQDLKNHSNFEKRLRWELIEIELQDEEKYFLDMFENNEKKTNPHNLLVPVLLGICETVDLSKEPLYKIGDFPDVDVDYLPPVRDYLKNTWAPLAFGKENVCSIGNYGTFGLKSSLIDMARVHGYDRNEVLKITTNMGLKDDEGQALTLDKALELYPELKAYLDDHQDVEIAVRKLLHRNRSMGKHAGGLIICNSRIDNFVPLVRGTDGSPVSSWVEGLHGQDLGPVGLIKFDLLVVDGLYQVALATRYVKERHKLDSICALEGDWDWSDTSYLNDPESLAMANDGDLKCIFQYDSDGIRALATKGGVDSFDDLVAYVSLYRPSCLQMKMDEEYVERKRGRKLYEVPKLVEPYIGNTYGVMIYQETVMQILSIVGKIPLRDCYQVIKAISKKKLSAFIKYKDKFIENGQITLGKSKQEVENYWNQIEAFSGYGFNKTLTEDTIIYCVDGSKQIKDIRAGDKVYCVNEKGEQAQTEVVAVHDHGVIDVVEVAFDDGYSVKCTLNHKFLTEEGQVPLWKIIQDNLAVLSSPLGEQNAEETKLGSKLRRSVQQQEKDYKTSQDLPQVQRDILAKENGKIQSQSSLWTKVSNQIQVGRSFERMSGLYLFEMERDGEEACISMWDRVSERKNIGGTSPALREMHGNKKEEYSGSYGQIEQGQSCSRTQGDILCNCQENLCKKGCAGVKSGTTEEMEGQQSRGLCKIYRKGTALSKKIKNGDVVEKISWMEAEENMLRERQEVCGFGKEKDLDRGGRTISLLASCFEKEQARTQFGIHTRQRSNTERGMLAKRRYNVAKIEPEVFSQQNRRNEEGMAGFTPDYAQITSTRNLVHRRVLRVVPVGKRQCYDLEVAVSTHNFILPNGIVTANSHATAYSYISSRQLYLKSHYPLEFFVSSLQCQDNEDKRRDYITEALNHGVNVKGLDINKSKQTFDIVYDAIYIGFGNVKGIGEDKAKKIADLQPYSGFEDFLDRYGTEAGTIKPFIGLRIFGENVEEQYAYWLKYTEVKKQFKDKEKRFDNTNKETLLKLIDLVPVSMRGALGKLQKLEQRVFDVVISHVEKLNDSIMLAKVKELQKKFSGTVMRYATSQDKVDIPQLGDVKLADCKEVDEKFVNLLLNKEECEVAFYGFVWSNKIREFANYKGGFNFDLAKRKSITSPRPYYMIYGVIQNCTLKSFKNGNGKYASLELMDDNLQTNKVTIWEDDYIIFKEDLNKGNFISIQVVVSTKGFQGFTMFGPPKHKRHTLPAKRYDTRLVVLEDVSNV